MRLKSLFGADGVLDEKPIFIEGTAGNQSVDDEGKIYEERQYGGIVPARRDRFDAGPKSRSSDGKGSQYYMGWLPTAHPVFPECSCRRTSKQPSGCTNRTHSVFSLKWMERFCRPATTSVNWSRPFSIPL